MMSQQQNDLITRIGPQDPAGKLMRMYWQPAALMDELEGERPVRPVKLLGENFVLFRDQNGRYGLIDRDCPHRGADLAFGRLENGGLRCAFSRLAVRRQRSVSGNSRRAGRLIAVPEHQATRLSRRREARHSIGRTSEKASRRRFPRSTASRRRRPIRLRSRA